MTRPHLTVEDFPATVKDAAEALFAAKPWTLTPDAQHAAATTFTEAVLPGASVVLYPDVEPKTVSVEPYRRSIGLYGFSIFNLFRGVGALVNGQENALSPEPVDAFDWAASLFYAVRPAMFRARVREGRIGSMTARQTYTKDSWNRLKEAGVTTDHGDLLCSGTEAAAILRGEPAPVSEAVVEAEAVIADAQTEAPSQSEPVNDTLNSLSRDEVRALAKTHGIPRGDMNKTQLVEALRAAGVTG